MWGVKRKPRSLAAARSNVFAALGHLGMLTAQTCPRGLLHEVEHILQVRSLTSKAPEPTWVACCSWVRAGDVHDSRVAVAHVQDYAHHKM